MKWHEAEVLPEENTDVLVMNEEDEISLAKVKNGEWRIQAKRFGEVKKWKRLKKKKKHKKDKIDYNMIAVGSFIMGIISFLGISPMLTGILGIIGGIVYKAEGKHKKRIYATSGILFGIAGIAIRLIILIVIANVILKTL